MNDDDDLKRAVAAIEEARPRADFLPRAIAKQIAEVRREAYAAGKSAGWDDAVVELYFLGRPNRADIARLADHLAANKPMD